MLTSSFSGEREPMSARGTCPVCGADDIRLKADGTLYKHDDADGAQCTGSGQQPAPARLQAPDPGDDWDDEPDDQPDPDGDQDEQGGDQAPVTDLGQDGFTWALTVKQPCHYLDDAAWHQANGRMAEKAAHESGLGVLGGAQCTNVTTGNEGTLVLTYTLPVDRP